MTEVEFHTGVADPVGFACRLLRKAVRQGARLQVTAPPERLADLDVALWTTEERDFLPHVRVPGAASGVAARTPVWLAATAQTQGAPRVLVNLGAERPSLAAVDRVIEIVSAEPDEAAQGRARWREYKALGAALKHHAPTAGGGG